MLPLKGIMVLDLSRERTIGNRHFSIVPYGSYDTADLPILITIGNDHQFENFCRSLEVSWNSDPDFATNQDRVKNRSREVWLKAFQSRGFPFGPIKDLSEVAKDPQTIARNLFTLMDDGKTPCIQSPIHFSRTPIQKYAKPPKLNEHSKASFS